MVKVAVVGAGMAGLVCAQRLRQAGCDVMVVEKSRGLGGRVATRRLQGTHADHGTRYFMNQGLLSRSLIQSLSQQGVLKIWTSTWHEIDAEGRLQVSADRDSGYASPQGLTAVAKFLAHGLDIQLGQRVIALAPVNHTWTLTLESGTGRPLSAVVADAVVLAIPAPQVLALLSPLADQPLPASFVEAIQSVEFAPCLTAIATYAATHQASLTEISWKAVRFPGDIDLNWLSLDSSKQEHPQRPVLVVQSTAAYAHQYLESTDLQLAGHHLLAKAARSLLPWFHSPEELQVHRWRYAFVSRALSVPCLFSAEPLPIASCGDWCGGDSLENALHSGWAAAQEILNSYDRTPVPESVELSFNKLLQVLEPASPSPN